MIDRSVGVRFHRSFLEYFSFSLYFCDLALFPLLFFCFHPVIHFSFVFSLSSRRVRGEGSEVLAQHETHTTAPHSSAAFRCFRCMEKQERERKKKVKRKSRNPPGRQLFFSCVDVYVERIVPVFLLFFFYVVVVVLLGLETIFHVESERSFFFFFFVFFFPVWKNPS